VYSEKIKSLVSKHYDEAAKIRQHLHKYPELSLQEEKTAKLVEETLAKAGIKSRRLFKTGVVGLIEGGLPGKHGLPGKTVLLRADMDALAMTEDSGLDYASAEPGVMHACGHDGHTAGLLLAAMALSEMKDDLKGNVKLMFQPGEETVGGAAPMIEEGVLESPKVDAAFGCHLWGQAPEGTVWVKNGPVMAGPDQFDIKVIGKGGHGAQPHVAADPVVMAAQIINSFQTVISRRKNPLEPAVVSVCAIHGGTVHNIIPESVTMIGTIRTFDENLRQWIPKALEDTVAAITRSSGGDYEFDLALGYPPLINDEKMTDLSREAIAKIIGAENVKYMKDPSMGGEDFSYLCQKVPASFFFVGIAKDMENAPIHHNPKFAWDDRVLQTAAASLCQIAFDFLNGG